MRMFLRNEPATSTSLPRPSESWISQLSFAVTLPLPLPFNPRCVCLTPTIFKGGLCHFLQQSALIDHRVLVGDLRFSLRHHPGYLQAFTTDAITCSHLPLCLVVVVFSLFPCVPFAPTFVATLYSTIFASLFSAVVSQLRQVSQCSFVFLQVAMLFHIHHRHHSST